MSFGHFHHFHLVGAGGVGMCGLGELLIGLGLRVSGCDIEDSERTHRLESLGAAVHSGHEISHLDGVDAVVVTAAVDPDNPELIEARRRGLAVIRRAEMLAELMRLKIGIAVAGTHGKTTTTAMIGHLLAHAELDPTVVVGGRVRSFGGHSRRGHGALFVCEADEYARSFLELAPVYAVVTNIEAEHLDCYGSRDELRRAFSTFVRRVPFWGAAVLCGDDPAASALRDQISPRTVTYGTSADCDVRARNVDYDCDGTRFTLSVSGRDLGELHLPLTGHHNVLNALAAVAVGLELKVPLSRMRAGLAEFAGVARRFEIYGDCNGSTVVDDYAHHPTEVRAALAAARQRFPDRRLVAVFQPHLYSRTREFADEFAAAVLTADAAIILPIYAAREDPIPGVSAKLIVDAAHRAGHRQIEIAASLEDSIELLRRLSQPDDVVLTLGAGDVYRVAEVLCGGAA